MPSRTTHHSSYSGSPFWYCTTINTVHSTTSKFLFHCLCDNSPSPQDQHNHIPTKKSQLDILESSVCAYIPYPQTTGKNQLIKTNNQNHCSPTIQVNSNFIPSQETHVPANNPKILSYNHDYLNPLSTSTYHPSKTFAPSNLTENQNDDISSFLNLNKPLNLFQSLDPNAMIPMHPISPISTNQSTLDPPLSTTPKCLNYSLDYPKPIAQKTPVILFDTDNAKLSVTAEPSLKLQTSPHHQKGPSKRHRDSNTLNNSSSKKPKIHNSSQVQSSISIYSNQIHWAATSYGPHTSKWGY